MIFICLLVNLLSDSVISFQAIYIKELISPHSYHPIEEFLVSFNAVEILLSVKLH
jgi:hypothetical protein